MVTAPAMHLPPQLAKLSVRVQGFSPLDDFKAILVNCLPEEHQRRPETKLKHFYEILIPTFN